MHVDTTKKLNLDMTLYLLLYKKFRSPIHYKVRRFLLGLFNKQKKKIKHTHKENTYNIHFSNLCYF